MAMSFHGARPRLRSQSERHSFPLKKIRKPRCGLLMVSLRAYGVENLLLRTLRMCKTLSKRNSCAKATLRPQKLIFFIVLNVRKCASTRSQLRILTRNPWWLSPSKTEALSSGMVVNSRSVSRSLPLVLLFVLVNKRLSKNYAAP